PVDKSPMPGGCSWVGGRFAAMVARLRAGSCRRPCLHAGSPSVQWLGGELDDRRDQAFERASVSRSLFRPERERQRWAYRVHRRDHDFPHHGLHCLRQPANSRQCGHGQRWVFVATCIAAAVSTLVMALYANYPIALAPGMGLNAFFAFTVVLGHKYTWQQA